MQVINAYEAQNRIRASNEVPVLLKCKQTRGGIYDSHPLAYFSHEMDIDVPFEFYSDRGHNEGLTNWLAYKNLIDQGFTVDLIDMVFE